MAKWFKKDHLGKRKVPFERKKINGSEYVNIPDVEQNQHHVNIY
jgi:hypothetical protein